MYALIIEEELFVFDHHKNYGFISLDGKNLNDFIKVLSFELVLENCKKYDNGVYQVEEYSHFLHKICLMYLRDFL